MANNKVDPETMQKIIKVAIAVLTALLGFFSGVGAQAAVFHFSMM